MRTGGHAIHNMVANGSSGDPAVCYVQCSLKTDAKVKGKKVLLH